jgi:hypothetical protein
MARFIGPTPEQEQVWKEWVASRPDSVRAVAERFEPWSLYRMKSTGQRVTIASIFEDGTLSVNVTGEFNCVMMDRRVFGINPDDLEPCDLPDENEIIGTALTDDQVEDGLPTSLPWNEKLVGKLRERDYRHAYMMEGVKTWIARQVRALREQRGWSQDDLGRETGKPQSAISRVEDPDYGKLTLQTLFDLARVYDLPLLVQFVEWSDWLCRMNDTSSESLQEPKRFASKSD